MYYYMNLFYYLSQLLKYYVNIRVGHIVQDPKGIQEGNDKQNFYRLR